MSTKTEQLDPEIKPNKLGVTPVSKLLGEYALPSIIATSMVSLYNIVDTIFIGRYVGELGVAATTVALPIMIIFVAFSMWIGVGANSSAAIRLGQGEEEEANLFLGNTLTMMLVLSAITIPLGVLLLDPLLTLCGATDANRELSRQFTLVFILGFILSASGNAFNNFIRTDGNPRFALYTMLVGGAVNVVLNYVFVAMLGWGVAGSALATVIGQGCTSVMAVGYFLTSKSTLKLKKKYLRIKARIVKTSMKLGVATFALQIAASLVLTFINYQIIVYGAQDPIGTDVGLATIGTMNKVSQFFVMPVIGMAIAMQPIIGFNYGAKNYHRLIKSFTTTLLWSIGIITIFWVISQFFPEPLVYLFGLSEEYLEFSVLALGAFTLFFPIVPIQVLGSNYFQSTGQPLRSMILSLTRQVLLLIPFLFILPIVLPQLFGLTPYQSIVYSVPLADLFAVLLTLVFLTKDYKRLKGLIKTEGCASEEEEVERMYTRQRIALERAAKFEQS